MEAKSKGIPILRRYSGGGTVYHDLGNVNYSLHRDKSFFNRTFAAEMIIKALKNHEKDLYLSPRHDIFLKSSKISGSAYKLSKDRAYHHGTFLLSTDLTKISTLLKSPLRIVDNDENFKFGGVSSVPSPVSNITNQLSFEKFVELVTKEFEPSEIILVSENDRNDLINHYEDELKSWHWTFGKSPPFKLILNENILLIESGIVKQSENSNFIGQKLCNLLNKNETLDLF